MLDTTRSAEDLRAAIGVALSSGVSESEILSMVATATSDVDCWEPKLPGLEEEGLPVFTELPAGLIDVPAAMKKYGCKNSTLRTWISRGLLVAQGRLRASAPGGGYLVVCEDDLLKQISAPPRKGGRPRKIMR